MESANVTLMGRPTLPGLAPMHHPQAGHLGWLALGSVLVAGFVLLPFLGKAFTIDDPIFLRQAEKALLDPWHSTSISLVWGDAPGPSGSASGPGMSWLLVPAVLAGSSEVVAHLGQLLGLAVAIFSTVFLGKRLGLSGGWAGASGLILATTPAVLGMAGTAMPDVWAMALGVLGIERSVAWRDERRWRQGAAAVLALSYAALTRSHAILLVGIAAFLMVRDPWVDRAWRNVRLTSLLPIAASPAAVALVLWLTREPNPQNLGLVGGTMLWAKPASIAGNLAAFATNWAFALPLTIPWAMLRWRRLLGRWWLVVLGIVAMGGLNAVARNRFPPYWYLAVPFAGLTVAVIWDLLATAWEERRWSMLTLGCWLFVALVALPYEHIPPKYLLVSAPAAAILVAMELSRTEGAWPRWLLSMTCVAGIALGVAILRADQQFGEIGRRAAAAIIAPRTTAGGTVWFGGHWGFQWYAERAGGRVLTLTPPYPQPGDLIILSRRSDLSPAILGLVARHPGVTHVGRIQDSTPGGRVMSGGAGFYSNLWGLLPWVWDDGPADIIDVLGIE